MGGSVVGVSDVVDVVEDVDVDDVASSSPMYTSIGSGLSTGLFVFTGVRSGFGTFGLILPAVGFVSTTVGLAFPPEGFAFTSVGSVFTIDVAGGFLFTAGGLVLTMGWFVLTFWGGGVVLDRRLPVSVAAVVLVVEDVEEVLILSSSLGCTGELVLNTGGLVFTTGGLVLTAGALVLTTGALVLDAGVGCCVVVGHWKRVAGCGRKEIVGKTLLVVVTGGRVSVTIICLVVG